jgi:cytidyltransferase-like protein
MIIKSIYNLKEHLSWNPYNKLPTYVTSGGFDPLHIGHVRCIKETALLDKAGIVVVVVVNADSFLLRKKGYIFMSLEERMEIIDSIKGVDFVTSWESTDDQTCIGAIEVLEPNYFTKGGDRFDLETIPEWNICNKLNCNIITGLGDGGKIQSSSELVDRLKNSSV